MGGGSSKQTYLTYDEAVKRVSETELKRLKDAFKRYSSVNGYMVKNVFIKEVLGDAVPIKLAEALYMSCGGTSKGLTFKELFSALVLITKGSQEEKFKFIFGVFADEGLQYVQKSDMDSLLVATEGQAHHALAQLFRDTDRVDYELFRTWLVHYRDSTAVSRWLLTEPFNVDLSDDRETPTFYQTLAGVTHLVESDIIALEKMYFTLKNQSTCGKFDIETFRALVCPPVPDAIVNNLFLAIDENRDNHIDFKEMACGISACCRGPMTERLKFCFKVFDADGSGQLSRANLEHMVEIMALVRSTSADQTQLEEDELGDVCATSLARYILSHHSSGDYISQADFLVWANNHELPTYFLSLLFQICHVVFGLQPQNKEEEGSVICGWLCRTDKEKFSLGQTWYLVSMAWWKEWVEWITYTPVTPRSTKLCPSLSRTTNSDTQLIGLQYSTLQQSNSITDWRAKYLNTNNTHNSDSNTCVTRPGQIDNSGLVLTPTPRVTSLTNEGGRLRKDKMLARGIDFQLVPEAVWKALVGWYGGAPALPREVYIPEYSQEPELELFPVYMKLYRHQLMPARSTNPTPHYTGMMGGISGMLPGSVSFPGTTSHPSQPQPPRRYMAHTACFSRKYNVGQMYDFISTRLRLNREDIRLWLCRDDNNQSLLEDDSLRVSEFPTEPHVLIEVRNKDLTWPEELSQLAKNKAIVDKGPTIAGVAGLSNLGNTCFMNSALQCVSNTKPLTMYFKGGMYMYELNRSNPLGMKGHIALRYAELIKELWSGQTRSLAPIKMRWTIAKYAPRFSGFQQHDCQELLAFLLDGLHEDLNRVQIKPYVELKDSDGRDDHIVAKEAWENHKQRNKSVIVDLFHGQLKSEVRCRQCGHTSVRFDPFTYLSLPLPMESCLHIEIVVQRLDGSTPVKYGLRLNVEEKYWSVKTAVSDLANIPATQILLVQVCGALIKSFPHDSQKMRVNVVNNLYAYEVPPIDNIPQMSASEERGSKASVVSHTSSLTNGSIPNHMTSSLLIDNNNSEHKLDHERTPSNASSSSNTCLSRVGELPYGLVVALHRKMLRQDVYFLSSQKTRPSVFGTPLILPCEGGVTHQQLYGAVWAQVGRLVSPLPPSMGDSNHALDCDDSLGYNYPFTLKAVCSDGTACVWCPWYRFCRGCPFPCDDQPFNEDTRYVAIDWEPTALHLRYQTSQERVAYEHVSVGESRRRQTEPIDLATCLSAFTREEQLGEEERWFCSKCKTHQLADKKLQIWRLPPVLIIHLKRFQFVNGRWVKSQKIVQFPFQDFDPSDYLVSREASHDSLSISMDEDEDESVTSRITDDLIFTSNATGDATMLTEDKVQVDKRQSESSLELEDYKDVKYDLYAMACHSGMMGGGHYVSYGKNPNGSWYCYNDSMCKEISSTQIDTKSAYILFYERKDLELQPFLPDIRGREPDTNEVSDECEGEIKKMCCVM